MQPDRGKFLRNDSYARPINAVAPLPTNEMLTGAITRQKMKSDIVTKSDALRQSINSIPTVDNHKQRTKEIVDSYLSRVDNIVNNYTNYNDAQAQLGNLANEFQREFTSGEGSEYAKYYQQLSNIKQSDDWEELSSLSKAYVGFKEQTVSPLANEITKENEEGEIVGTGTYKSFGVPRVVKKYDVSKLRDELESVRKEVIQTEIPIGNTASTFSDKGERITRDRLFAAGNAFYAGDDSFREYVQVTAQQKVEMRLALDEEYREALKGENDEQTRSLVEKEIAKTQEEIKNVIINAAASGLDYENRIQNLSLKTPSNNNNGSTTPGTVPTVLFSETQNIKTNVDFKDFKTFAQALHNVNKEIQLLKSKENPTKSDISKLMIFEAKEKSYKTVIDGVYKKLNNSQKADINNSILRSIDAILEEDKKLPEDSENKLTDTGIEYYNQLKELNGEELFKAVSGDFNVLSKKGVSKQAINERGGSPLYSYLSLIDEDLALNVLNTLTLGKIDSTPISVLEPFFEQELEEQEYGSKVYKYATFKDNNTIKAFQEEFKPNADDFMIFSSKGQWEKEATDKISKIKITGITGVTDRDNKHMFVAEVTHEDDKGETITDKVLLSPLGGTDAAKTALREEVAKRVHVKNDNNLTYDQRMKNEEDLKILRRMAFTQSVSSYQNILFLPNNGNLTFNLSEEDEGSSFTKINDDAYEVNSKELNKVRFRYSNDNSPYTKAELQYHLFAYDVAEKVKDRFIDSVRDGESKPIEEVLGDIMKRNENYSEQDAKFIYLQEFENNILVSLGFEPINGLEQQNTDNFLSNFEYYRTAIEDFLGFDLEEYRNNKKQEKEQKQQQQ